MSANLESSAVATGLKKDQFSFQSQRRTMSKNVHTTIQLCSFHMLARLCSKSFKLVLSNVWTKNIQMYKLGFKVAEESEIKLPTFLGSLKKTRKFQKNIYFYLIDYDKPLTAWITTNCKILKEWEYQTTLSVLRETCMWAKKEQLKLDIKQVTGLKWERGTTRLYIVTLFI